MKKKDLKTGMIIKDRDNNLGMVMLKTPIGDVIAGDDNSENKTWFPLKDYDNKYLFESKDGFKEVYKHKGDGNIHRASFDLAHYELIFINPLFEKATS